MTKVTFITNPSKIETNLFSFNQFKGLVDHYLNKDPRELNFQNRVILFLLETLLTNRDIEVVDTSTLYNRGPKNSKWLDTSKFKADNCAPPDLLLTKNWNLDNVNNEVNYLCAIEIKSPNSNEGIFGKEFEKYSYRVKKEVNGHLSVHKKLILTDCYRWQFIERQDNLFFDLFTIDLVDSSRKWKIELDDELNEWYELKTKIISFLK